MKFNSSDFDRDEKKDFEMGSVLQSLSISK